MVQSSNITKDRLLAAARQLSTGDRIDLFIALREELRGIAPDDAVSEDEFLPDQLAELDRRMARHESNPEAAIPWDEIEQELTDRCGLDK